MTAPTALSEDVEVGRELFERALPNARPVGGGDVDPARADPFWSSIQELVLIIGPLFLQRFLDRELGGSLLDAENLERWIVQTVGCSNPVSCNG